MKYIKLLHKFEKQYYINKGKEIYKAQSREFIYKCIKNNIYNTELVCTLKGVKNVSRFICKESKHIEYIKQWCQKIIYIYTVENYERQKKSNYK